MAEKKLPNDVYVWWEHPTNGDPYLACSTDWRGNPDGLQVGVYELNTLMRVKVTEELE